MSLDDNGGTSPEDRRTLIVVTVVLVTAAALFLVLPVDFLLTYFMNDMVTVADHFRFLGLATLAAVALSAIYSAGVMRITPLPLGRCAVGCFLVTGSVFLAAGAGYTALSLLSALDYAVGAEWSNRLCVVLSVLQAAAALGAFVTGRRALSLR